MMPVAALVQAQATAGGSPDRRHGVGHGRERRGIATVGRMHIRAASRMAAAAPGTGGLTPVLPRLRCGRSRSQPRAEHGRAARQTIGADLDGGAAPVQQRPAGDSPDACFLPVLRSAPARRGAGGAGNGLPRFPRHVRTRDRPQARAGYGAGVATVPTGSYVKTSSASPGAAITVSTGVGRPSAACVRDTVISGGKPPSGGSTNR